MRIGKKDDILTSVRVREKLFEDFKQASATDKITMRNLLERAMFLYLTNEEFKRTIHNQVGVHYTGNQD
jgi:hypothetical protein